MSSTLPNGVLILSKPIDPTATIPMQLLHTLARCQLVGRHELEPDLHLHLVPGHAAIFDLTANRVDFEPVEALQRLAGPVDRGFNRFGYADVRRADQLDDFVRVSGHFGLL